MNASGSVAEPRVDDVTITSCGPAVAPGGVVTVTTVPEVFDVTPVPAWPPNVIDVMSVSPVPVMFTVVPPPIGPLSGASAVSVSSDW